jgi:hypothetical protein
MDDDFYKERARHIRELAEKADPFIQKRLLNGPQLRRDDPATSAQDDLGVSAPPQVPG